MRTCVYVYRSVCEYVRVCLCQIDNARSRETTRDEERHCVCKCGILDLVCMHLVCVYVRVCMSGMYVRVCVRGVGM